MHRVGLTGGVACGKSTSCEYFARLGASIINADQIAREVVQPGQEAYPRIVESFGTAILNADGTINRQVLGRMVFGSSDLRLQLNGITHPIIIRRTDEMMDALEREGRTQVCIVDAALMVESGSYRRFEKLIVVWCTEEQQIERQCARSGISREEALQRIHAQMPLAEKRRFADFEIDASKDLAFVAQQVEGIYRQILG